MPNCAATGWPCCSVSARLFSSWPISRRLRRPSDAPLVSPQGQGQKRAGRKRRQPSCWRRLNRAPRPPGTAGEDESGESEAAPPEAAHPEPGPEAPDPALPEALTDAGPARRGFLRRWRRESQPEDAAPSRQRQAQPSPRPLPSRRPRRPSRNPLAPGTRTGPGHPHRPRAGVSRTPAGSLDGGGGARSPGGRGPGGDRGGSRSRGPARHVPAPAGTVEPDPGGPERRSGSACSGGAKLLMPSSWKNLRNC